MLGDNGYYLGDRGYADKWLMHDLSIRVPLIMYDPGNKSAKNKVIDDMVMNIDISPTILAFAGLATPEIIHGESLLPYLKGQKIKKRGAILCEHLMKKS
jgi:arylsulfatase A-like enzyme